MSDEALLVVDVQNDFLAGGALAVPRGDEVLPVINGLMDEFDSVIATIDYHPKGHVSFASSHEGRAIGDVVEVDGVAQMLWPDHCVQNSVGAELAEELRNGPLTKFVCKGIDPLVDSYSAFFDNNGQNDTGLAEYLRDCGISKIFVCGLALDYCVKFSVLDALHLGFDVTLIEDATRAVNAEEGDGERAIAQMRAAGAKTIKSSEVKR